MPRTPDEFPGISMDEGICLYDQYGDLPDCYGGILYSDGYFYAKDAYGIFNIRLNVHPHISSHVGGTDSFYVISQEFPTANEDVNDGYLIGWRWINTIDGYEYVLVDNTAGAAVWKQTTIGSVSGVEPLFFDAYDTVGGTNISSGWTDVPLDGERIKDSAFSHASPSAEVTINTAGTYLVLARVGTDISSGSTRSESEMRVMLDSGFGYAEIPGSRGIMYNRDASQGGTHASVALILSLNVGDKVKIQAQRISGSSTVILLSDNSGLVIASSLGGGIGTDELVKVSSNDTTSGYLEDKIVGDGYVSITTINDGGNENLQISVNLDGYLNDIEHEILDTLTHEIVESSYDEVTYSGNKVSNYIVWETAAKLKKIREEQYSYGTGNRVSQVVTIQYDSSGSVKTTVTENYTYSGNKVQNITRTKS